MQQKSHMAGKIYFLLLALPLGIVYFVIPIVGLSLGLGTFIIWIGIPILMGTLAAIWGFAALEREMVAKYLHIYIPARPRNYTQRTLQQRFSVRLLDPYTWTSLLYMFLKLIIGSITFSIVLSFVLTTITLLLGPFIYLLLTYIYASVGLHDPWYMIGASGHGYGWGLIYVNGQFDVLAFIQSFIFIPLGLGFWWLTRVIVNALAAASGALARTLLGPGEQEMVAPKDASYDYRTAQPIPAYDYQGYHAVERDTQQPHHYAYQESSIEERPNMQYPQQRG